MDLQSDEFDIPIGGIDGDAQVLMHDGSYKKLQDIKRGDFVATGNNVSASVKCLIQYDVYDYSSIYIDDILLDPYQPVKNCTFTKWLDPIALADPLVHYNDYKTFYNVWLSDSDKIYIKSPKGHHLCCATVSKNFNEELAKKLELYSVHKLGSVFVI